MYIYICAYCAMCVCICISQYEIDTCVSSFYVADTIKQHFQGLRLRRFSYRCLGIRLAMCT